MAEGPSVLSPDDELADTSCLRKKGHTHEHQWYSDDGSVLMRWDDDWSLDDADWRNLDD